jgi:hypothetical protein
MKLISIKPSDRKNKRYVAEFCMCNGESKCKSNERKRTHFGFRGGSTYIDNKDDKKKDAYIARHKVNENWNDPTSAGALARYILWNKPTLKESIADYKKRFNL